MWSQKSLVRAILVFALAWMTVGITFSCNTMKGAGKDVEKTGEKMQDAADKH